ncbi:hypothetical protein B7L88_gp068 [Rhizobium phage RHEph10]|uniref:hypothetical protein n=1 Tax=Rhizobium phage RHEph10 TaxID=1220717 RepID=UPI0002AB34B7|nr:hypothetical protein B7L88_gp068 [Rhizobium phage RHEph10]AGC36112.1 hypothetical protein RHEph10_gp068 [Rhizobium phage RHEph10]
MPPKPTKTPISAEEKALTERAGKRLLEALKNIDEPFAVEGMHTRPVMKQDATDRPGYRQKPLLPKSEHFLADFYLGAKGQLIFKAVPTETKEYDWADVDEASMDAVFPLVGSSLAEALDITECEDFRAIVTTMKARILKEDADAAAAALEEKKEASKAYETNPNFGRF